ncbi:MAG: hypothetical protein QUS14_01770 [Pyrinomonadaceae bacterium]|nr:hypothetical protein [Pyrinomonadaceae bacterium]
MGREPIHQNLSTSFVDLKALVKHLKGLQFVGSIHVELSSYEADIIFTAEKNIHAREYDHATGRISFGREALFRILDRAREPFGRIHVYRSVPDAFGGLPAGVFIDESISKRARRTLSQKADSPATHLIRVLPATEKPELAAVTAELLETIKESLDSAGLDFPEAFRNTCSRVAAVYPFLHPKLGSIRFEDRTVKLKVPVDERKFTDALLEVLSIIISRVPELNTRASAIETVRKDLSSFFQRRQPEIDRLGLSRIARELLDGE